MDREEFCKKFNIGDKIMLPSFDNGRFLAIEDIGMRRVYGKDSEGNDEYWNIDSSFELYECPCKHNYAIGGITKGVCEICGELNYIASDEDPKKMITRYKWALIGKDMLPKETEHFYAVEDCIPYDVGYTDVVRLDYSATEFEA